MHSANSTVPTSGTSIIDPHFYAALTQALLSEYIQPARKLLTYKVTTLNTLYDQDRFSMSDKDVETLNKRIKYLAREVEILNNLIAATDDALAAIIEQYNHIDRSFVETCIENEVLTTQLSAARKRAENWEYIALFLHQQNQKAA